MCSHYHSRGGVSPSPPPPNRFSCHVASLERNLYRLDRPFKKKYLLEQKKKLIMFLRISYVRALTLLTEHPSVYHQACSAPPFYVTGVAFATHRPCFSRSPSCFSNTRGLLVLGVVIKKKKGTSMNLIFFVQQGLSESVKRVLYSV